MQLSLWRCLPASHQEVPRAALLISSDMSILFHAGLDLGNRSLTCKTVTELFVECDRIVVEAAIHRACQTGSPAQQVASLAQMQEETDITVIPTASCLCMVLLGPCLLPVEQKISGHCSPRSPTQTTKRTLLSAVVPTCPTQEVHSSGAPGSKDLMMQGPPLEGISASVEIQEEPVLQQIERQLQEMIPIPEDSVAALPGQVSRQGSFESEDGFADASPQMQPADSFESELSFRLSSSPGSSLRGGSMSVESICSETLVDGGPKDVGMQTDPYEVKECIKCRAWAKPPLAPISRDTAWVNALVQRKWSKERQPQGNSALDGHWTLIAAQRRGRIQGLYRLKIDQRRCEDFKGNQWKLEEDGGKLMLFDKTLELEGTNLFHLLKDKEDLIYVRGDAGVDWDVEIQRSKSLLSSRQEVPKPRRRASSPWSAPQQRGRS